jgi:hypothetical protein
MDAKTYSGGCHCGKVRYQVTTDLAQVIECNCSHCAMKGFLLAFVPPTQFELVAGEENLQHYQFNKHVIDHYFCTACGVQSFARGHSPKGPMVAVNTRCLDGLDPKSLSPMPFDGKSL